MAEIVGNGQLVSTASEQRSGRFESIVATRDLLEVMDNGDDPLVAHISSPNVTMIAPIYERLAGIICDSGDEMAHVAIVARELGIPCSVQAEFERDPSEIEGRSVHLGSRGEVFLDE